MKEKIRIETLPHIEIWVYLYNNCTYLYKYPFYGQTAVKTAYPLANLVIQNQRVKNLT